MLFNFNERRSVLLWRYNKQRRFYMFSCMSYKQEIKRNDVCIESRHYSLPVKNLQQLTVVTHTVPPRLPSTRFRKSHSHCLLELEQNFDLKIFTLCAFSVSRKDLHTHTNKQTNKHTQTSKQTNTHTHTNYLV